MYRRRGRADDDHGPGADHRPGTPQAERAPRRHRAVARGATSSAGANHGGDGRIPFRPRCPSRPAAAVAESASGGRDAQLGDQGPHPPGDVVAIGRTCSTVSPAGSGSSTPGSACREHRARVPRPIEITRLPGLQRFRDLREMSAISAIAARPPGSPGRRLELRRHHTAPPASTAAPPSATGPRYGCT
jgi:hypothetical protein